MNSELILYKYLITDKIRSLKDLFNLNPDEKLIYAIDNLLESAILFESLNDSKLEKISEELFNLHERLYSEIENIVHKKFQNELLNEKIIKEKQEYYEEILKRSQTDLDKKEYEDIESLEFQLKKDIRKDTRKDTKK